MDDEELARQLRAWSSGPGPARSAASWRREVALDSGAPATTALLDDPPDDAVVPDVLVPDAPDHPRQRWVARAAIVVLVVAVASAIWAAADRAREPSVASSPEEGALAAQEQPFVAGPCPTPPSRPTDPEELRRYLERADQLYEESKEEARRTGFQKMSGPDWNGEGYVCGWAKLGTAETGVTAFPGGTVIEGLPELVPGGGSPLYDGIDGNLMGYLYPYVGFVTVEEASAPGFDPVALRLDENGCDPLTGAC